MATDPTRKPWKQANPRKKDGTSKPLTASQKSEARARARKAGRRYPNLVDNMAVARAAAGSGTKKKKQP